MNDERQREILRTMGQNKEDTVPGNSVVISCRNVCKIFGPKPETVWRLVEDGVTRREVMERTGHVVAVRNVSFDVRENEIFVVMGLSGSGKSTLIRCINRLIEPTRGQILIDGVDIARAKRAQLREIRRHKLSMVFQNFGLLPHRSVLDNVAFGLEIRGESRDSRHKKAMQTLEMIGLKGWENSRLNELSGGMQQRVGLARSLVMDSEIVLMDEPFSALDPLVRRQMQDEFLKLRAAVKKTVVFITHDLLEALKLGDRIAVMKDGEIIQLGTPLEIISNPEDDYVREFVKDVPKAKVLQAGTIMEEPTTVVWENFGVEVAVRDMSESESDACFVIDSRGRLKGALTMKRALEASGNGPSTLADIEQDEVVAVSPDTPVEEIIDIVAHTHLPVAVVDEGTRLLGIVTRHSLLRAMKPEQPPDRQSGFAVNVERYRNGRALAEVGV